MAHHEADGLDGSGESVEAIPPRTRPRFPSAADRHRMAEEGWAAQRRAGTGSDLGIDSPSMATVILDGRPAATAGASTEHVETAHDGLDVPEQRSPSAMVRPYVLTGGRTTPRLHLELERLVSRSTNAGASAAAVGHEQHAMVELCDRPRAVAEVAARMAFPVGVARVLLGDLIQLGVLVAHPVFAPAGGRPDRAHLHRVLHALRRI